MESQSSSEAFLGYGDVYRTGFIMRSGGAIDGPFSIIRPLIDPDRKIIISHKDQEQLRVAISFRNEDVNGLPTIIAKRITKDQVLKGPEPPGAHQKTSEGKENILDRFIQSLISKGIDIKLINPQSIVANLFHPDEKGKEFELEVNRISELLKQKGLSEKEISTILTDYLNLRQIIISYQKDPNKLNTLGQIRKILYLN